MASAFSAMQAAWTASGDSRALDFSDGSVWSTLASGHAVLDDQVLAVVLRKFRASMLSTATGDDLDALVTDLGGPERKAASAATVSVTVTRTSYVGSYTITTGTEVRGTDASGQPVVFEVTSGVSFSPSDTSKFVSATCTSTGRSGNVAASTLTTIAGLPSGFSVAQAERAAGGADDETDADYLARFRLSQLAAAGSGTPEWIENAALAVTGVSFATVNEDNIASEDGGYVGVFIGDPDAGASTPLVTAVQEAFDHPYGHAAGIEIRVFGCEREELAFTIAAKVRAGSGLDAEALTSLFIEYLDAAKVASTVYLSAAEAYVHAAQSDNLLSIDITRTSNGAHEVAPSAAYKAIRTAADGSQITCTVTEV